MAFAAARMILKDKRRKSKEDFTPPQRTRSKVFKSRTFLCIISRRSAFHFILKSQQQSNKFQKMNDTPNAHT